MNALLPIVFALYPIALGTAGVAWLWAARAERLGEWTLQASVSAAIVLFAFLAGPWAYTSYYLRYFLLGVFAYSLFRSCRRVGSEVAQTRRDSKWPSRVAISAAVLTFFAALDFFLIVGLDRDAESIDLAFPLTSGNFCVVQGGGSIITNPFHALSGSRLALDIVKLNRFGNRASGIFPATLEAYQVFGEELHSPCDGTVTAVRDGLPDNSPGRPDAQNSRGNHVVIECDDAELVLAHFMRGSIEVLEGDRLLSGRRLGRVGNSGNTLEPHLHISAKRKGRDVELRFDGRALTINSVVVGKQTP